MKSEEKTAKTKIIILAGGKGTRMESDLPKVLEQVKGRSMISRLLESVTESGVDDSPTVIVGYEKELVLLELNKENKKYTSTYQEERLGTGHAVLMAKESIENNADHVIVLYGDHPFISPETIKKLEEKHLASDCKITLATVHLPDFADWRAVFCTNFSRIIRDLKGNIVKDVQFKDATDEEKKSLEVNPCYFCFEAKWLWGKLETLDTNNAQKEYYLTDLLKMATNEGEKIESIEIEPREALGANTKAELAILEKFAP